MSGPQGTQSRIVVGVDGSEPSREALRWAVRQAGLTGATVEAVIAWHFFPYIAAGYAWAPLAAMEVATFAETAQKVVTDAVSSVVDPASTVPVITKVVEGNSAQALLDAASGAELRARRVHRGAARLSQPALRPPRAVPSRDHPRQGRCQVARQPAAGRMSRMSPDPPGSRARSACPDLRSRPSLGSAALSAPSTSSQTIRPGSTLKRRS